MQLNHETTTFTPQKFPIVLVCDTITKAANIGSLFRISDAFGIEKIIFCGSNTPLGGRFTKTSRATEKHVKHEVKETILNVLSNLKKKGYDIISLEITEKSKPIHSYKFKKNTPIALVVGNENFGISEEVISLSNETIHINMFGKNSSMNVAQATNIVLYEITKQLDSKGSS